MSITDVVNTISNLSIGLAALFAAWVAFKGLSSWREQNIFQTDSELVRRLIFDLYAYRDSLRKFRRDYLSADEEAEISHAEIPSLTQFDEYMELMRPVILRRFEAVSKAAVKFLATRQEASFHWGDNLPDAFWRIFDLQSEIRNLIQSYYLHVDGMKPELALAIKEQLKRSASILSSAADEEGRHDEQLPQSVKEIERYLRQKIGRTP